LAAELAAAVERAETAARASMPGQAPQLSRVALMRYAEQLLQSVPVVLRDGAIDDAACGQLLEDFDAEYERQFGAFAKALFQAVEVFAIRVEARVPGSVQQVTPARRAAAGEPRGERQVHWPEPGPLATPIYDGTALGDDQRIDGPAVIELPYTTIPVAPGQHLIRDAATDNLILLLEA
jgi:N-methylhydantoinase A